MSAALPIPIPAYPCQVCRGTYIWPAQHLHWSAVVSGWICIECWDRGEHGEEGPSLAEEIARQSAQARYDAARNLYSADPCRETRYEFVEAFRALAEQEKIEREGLAG